MTERTKVEVGAELELAHTDWNLVAEVSAATWKFQAKPATKLKLSVVADALYQRLSESQGSLPGAANFPDVDLTSLTFEALEKNSPNEPAGLVVQAVFGVNKSKDNREDQPSFTLSFSVARLGEGTDTKYLAGIASDGAIALVSKGAGVIGQLLGEVILDRLGLYYASKVIDDARIFNSDPKDKRHFPAGISLSARFGLRNSTVDISFSQSEGLTFPSPSTTASPTTRDRDQAPVPPQTPGTPPTLKGLEEKGRVWKDLNKTLGPLQLRRIGGEWISDQGRLGILLDAAISLAGLTVGLSGLSVNVEPQKLTSLSFSDLGFKLDGMALDFQRGPISISGMLLKGQNDGYSGKAMIRAATFSIGAIGAYGRTKKGEIVVLYLWRVYRDFGRSAMLCRAGGCRRVWL